MAESPARASIADTFTRLLRLSLPGGSRLVSREQLMAASEAELARVARHGQAREQQLAAQLLASPLDYRRWETEHLRLMSGVANPKRNSGQARALLAATFSLIHRRALFEYLRGHTLRGTARRDLVQHFHGQESFTKAMVAEHGIYQRSSASLICTEHLGTTLLVHQAFGDPLRRYENLYAEYFRSYCDSFLAPPADAESDSDSVRMLLPHLKRDVLDVRTRLMAMPPVPAPGSRPTR
jgi:hypothetical protein